MGMALALKLTSTIESGSLTVLSLTLPEEPPHRPACRHARPPQRFARRRLQRAPRPTSHPPHPQTAVVPWPFLSLCLRSAHCLRSPISVPRQRPAGASSASRIQTCSADGLGARLRHLCRPSCQLSAGYAAHRREHRGSRRPRRVMIVMRQGQPPRGLRAGGHIAPRAWFDPGLSHRSAVLRGCF